MLKETMENELNFENELIEKVLNGEIPVERAREIGKSCLRKIKKYAMIDRHFERRNRHEDLDEFYGLKK